MLKETREMCKAIDEMMNEFKEEFDFDTVCAMNSTDLKLLQLSVKLIEATKNFYMAQGQELCNISTRLDQLLPAREATNPDKI